MALVVIEHGGISPQTVPSLYELSRRVNYGDDIIVHSYWCNVPALMLFQHYKPEVYLDMAKVDIPLVRAVSSAGNPYLMGPGLPMLDFQHSKNISIPHVSASLMEAMQELYGIELELNIDGDKLYWNDDGKKVKFYSPQDAENHIWTYTNENFDYNAHEDYNHDNPPFKSSDRNAYGIQTKYPQVDMSVVRPLMFEKLASKLGTDLVYRSLTQEEQDIVTELEVIHSDPKWVLDYERPDIDWHPPIEEDGLEIEIEITKRKDLDNIIFEMDMEGLEATKQPPPDRDDWSTYVPIHVQGSHVIYESYNRDNLLGQQKHSIIYRPKVYDANGWGVWGDMNYIGNGQFTIDLPQDFKDNCVLPVIADPTIGYQTIGNSTNYVGNAILVTWYNQKIDQKNAFLQTISAANQPQPTTAWLCGVYQKDFNDAYAGAALEKDTQSHVTTGAALIKEFHHYPLVESNNDEQPVLNWTKNDIGLAISSNSGTLYNWIAYDIVAGTRHSRHAHTYTGSMPATLPALTSLGSAKYSIYIEYADNQQIYDCRTIDGASNWDTNTWIDDANVATTDQVVNPSYFKILLSSIMDIPAVMPSYLKGNITKVEVRARWRTSTAPNSIGFIPYFNGAQGTIYYVGETIPNSLQWSAWQNVTSSVNSTFTGAGGDWNDLLQFDLGIISLTNKISYCAEIQVRITATATQGGGNRLKDFDNYNQWRYTR